MSRIGASRLQTTGFKLLKEAFTNRVNFMVMYVEIQITLDLKITHFSIGFANIHDIHGFTESGVNKTKYQDEISDPRGFRLPNTP